MHATKCTILLYVKQHFYVDCSVQLKKYQEIIYILYFWSEIEFNNICMRNAEITNLFIENELHLQNYIVSLIKLMYSLY